MAYVQCGTITKSAGTASLGIQWSATCYVDRSTTPFRRRLYIDQIEVHYPSAYNYVSPSKPTVWIKQIASPYTEIINQNYELTSTVIDGSTTRRYTNNVGYIDLPMVSTTVSGDYSIYIGSIISYKVTSSSSMTTKSYYNDIYLRYPDYAGITITAPATVKLNALNQFTCPTVDLSGIYVYGSRQTFTAYGAFGQNYERVSDIYRTSSAKIARDTAFSSIYWYPSILDVAAGDFVNNVSPYKIRFELTDTGSGLDNNLLAWGEITGYIQYNETPPTNAKPSVSVSVTEISGAGLYATYGRYLKGKSQIRLQASIAANFGYGQSILTRTITLNGATATANQTVWPAVDATYYASAVDNHNASNNASLSYQVYDYWDPELPTFAIHRCKSDGTNDDAGAFVKIEWGISVAPLGNQNSKSLTIVHPQGSSTPTLSSYSASGFLIVAADIEHSYDITATLTDDLGSCTRTMRLSTAGAILDIHNGGDGIAFGKVAELSDTLEVTADWDVILNTTNAKKINLVAALEALATAAGINIYVNNS